MKNIFDDPKASNSQKDWGQPGELKVYVPIIARTRRFPLKKGKSTVIAGIKQFLSIFGHAITLCHGSTLANMKSDFNQSTSKKTVTVKNYH